MKNLLNSPTDGNMPSLGNPMQPATRPVNNTTLYGSLSGPDDNTTTYKQPYNKSSKRDCGCGNIKLKSTNASWQQQPNDGNNISAGKSQVPNPIPKNVGNRTNNRPFAFPIPQNDQNK